MRGLLAAIVEQADDVAVTDLEAGLEPMSRGTPRHADTVIAVLEPYYRSLETGARVLELARELGVPRVHAVANKVRDEADRRALEEFCRARSIDLFAVVPHDDAVTDADRQGVALVDRAPDAPAVRALDALADRLLA